jgi:hypothetical protein
VYGVVIESPHFLLLLQHVIIISQVCYKPVTLYEASQFCSAPCFMQHDKAIDRIETRERSPW